MGHDRWHYGKQPVASRRLPGRCRHATHGHSASLISATPSIGGCQYPSASACLPAPPEARETMRTETFACPHCGLVITIGRSGKDESITTQRFSCREVSQDIKSLTRVLQMVDRVAHFGSHRRQVAPTVAIVRGRSTKGARRSGCIYDTWY